MSYLDLLERVAESLERQGIEVLFERGRPLSRRDLKKAQSAVDVRFPAGLADFYLEVGDGIYFKWEGWGDLKAAANHDIPTLEELVTEHVEDMKNSVEWDDSYDFRYTDDPALAKATAKRMRKWLAFHFVGKGDSFCLDTSIDPARVVLNQHDWMDGGTGDNGFTMAHSMFELYSARARVGFQNPRSCWWPEACDRDTGGVNWKGVQFNQKIEIVQRSRRTFCVPWRSGVHG